MREITIPKGVAEIARMAFYHCDQLETVHLQEGLRGIGWDAFSECASLSDIRLPNTLERIELRAFAHCTSLKQLTIPASVTTLYAGLLMRTRYCWSNAGRRWKRGCKKRGINIRWWKWNDPPHHPKEGK